MAARAVVAAAAAAVAAAQLAVDAVAFVTNVGAGTGYIGAYFGGNAAYLWATCPVPLVDVAAWGNTLYVSSANQIYSRPISGGPTTCGNVVLNPAFTNAAVDHLATDGTWVYFSEGMSKTIQRVPVTGGSPTVIIAAGADGVTGNRYGLTLWGGYLFYSVQGTSNSNGQQLNGVVQAFANGSNPQIYFNYNVNQQWWITDLVASSLINMMFAVEYRNASGGNPATNNVQAFTLQPANGPNVLITGLTPAVVDNTFLTLDDVQQVLWYTSGGQNVINVQNSTSRNAQPIYQQMATLPTSYGTLNGIAFIRGNSTSSSARFSYAQAQGTASPFPSPFASIAASASPAAASASPVVSGSGGATGSPQPSPSRSAASAAGLSTLVAAAAVAVAFAARRA